MLLSSAEKRQLLRPRLWAILHDGRGRLGRIVNFSLIVLIVVSVAIVPVEFLMNVEEFDYVIHLIEAVIVSLFTIEYFLRVYAAPNRWRYILSFFGIIDLLSIMPFYAGIFGTEYVRALRLVRLLKLGEIEATAEKVEEGTMQRGIGLVPGERVEYVVTKSPIIVFMGIVPVLIAIAFGIAILFAFEGHVIAIAVSIVLFLFALILLWKTWLDFGYDVIYVTNFRLIFQNQHILGRSINQVSYPSITNVKPFYPSVISYLLRYGSLVIDTAAEHPGQIGLHMVRKHEHAAHTIMQKSFESAQQPLTGSLQSQATSLASDDGRQIS